PKTPGFVPFFKTHDEFILWTKKQLEIKSMFNVRHLWSSIRPNGPDRPNKLNRIEVRICDFISHPVKILGIVALIECLIHNYLSTNKWPKVLSKTSKELEEIARSSDKQEELVAKDGLTAKLWDWRNDSENTAKQIISNLYTELSPTAKNLGIIKYFNQIQLILEEENEATQFLNHYGKTKSIQATIQYFIEKFAESDLSFSKIL
ncbi:MAG: putative glutamate--cysteine ligase, partial [Candidatus Melainabacteria bacterium]|nr:putative glutamate--cysteine ligase [Candidatus Melainabacteria bacterium]